MSQTILVVEDEAANLRLISLFLGSTPVVIMTADPTARMTDNINEASVSSLLIKPFRVRELVEAIRRPLHEKSQS